MSDVENQIRNAIDKANQSEAVICEIAKRLSKERESQLKYLSRFYKRHNIPFSDKSYVLWLVPDLFGYPEALECDVVLFDKDDNVIEIPFKTQYACFYPNKRIRTVSFPSGTAKKGVNIYGVPLVFDSYSALSNVKKIKITWRYVSDKILSDVEQYVTNLEACYNVSFEEPKDSNARMYTLQTRVDACDHERICEDTLIGIDDDGNPVYEMSTSGYERLLKEFDIVGNTYCNFDMDGQTFEQVSESPTVNVLKNEGIDDELLRELLIVHMIQCLTSNEMYLENMCLSTSRICQSYYYFERTCELKSDHLARLQVKF